MKRKKTGRPRANGRPRVAIDWKVFDALCAVRCTLAEIAGHFQCSEDSIERACRRDRKQGFADCYRQKATVGAVALRRKQFALAMSGNVVMCIFLGKQMLGQQDKTLVETRDVTKLTDEELAAERKALGLA